MSFQISNLALVEQEAMNINYRNHELSNRLDSAIFHNVSF